MFFHSGEFHQGAHLPHCDQKKLIHLITYRLANSLPREVLDRIQQELERVDEEFLSQERKRKMEYWLDQNMGECVLTNPSCAQFVVETWEHDHGKKYDLLSWVVMPNHVHVLVRIYEEAYLARMVKTWKSITAHRINTLLARTGTLWMRDYHDRYMRSPEHLFKAFNYILENDHNGGVLYGRK